MNLRKQKKQFPPHPSKTRGRWTARSYMLFVQIRTNPKVEAQVVYGRCLGQRSDGQCFNTVVALPWMQNRRYDWRPLARYRLDTYLLKGCGCRAKGVQTITCKMHRDLEWEWRADNDRIAGIRPPANAPIADAKMGVTTPCKVLHRDYPWTQLDTVTNEWVCDICTARQGAWADNPTWRNQFISQHSHCGFPASGYRASIAKCCLDYPADAAREAAKRAEKLEKDAGLLRAVEGYMKNTRGDFGERMSFEEAVQWMMKQTQRQDDPELKLLAGGEG